MYSSVKNTFYHPFAGASIPRNTSLAVSNYVFRICLTKLTNGLTLVLQVRRPSTLESILSKKEEKEVSHNNHNAMHNHFYTRYYMVAKKTCKLECDK